MGVISGFTHQCNYLIFKLLLKQFWLKIENSLFLQDWLIIFSKNSVNCCVSDINSVMICGIENHVCVQNTVLDLLEDNFDVHLIADACSSRSMTDR